MLFGHQNDDTKEPTGSPTMSHETVLTPPSAAGSSDGPDLSSVVKPQAPPDPSDDTSSSDASALNQPTDSAATPPPTTDPVVVDPVVATAPPAEASSLDHDELPPPPVDLPDMVIPEITPAAAAPLVIGDDDLFQLKQQALSQLEPLVDKLDQTPEEKFRTNMMMIQSTDNPTHIKNAYEAAQNIDDEKVRAQALLDIVNEINYFTQNTQK